MPSPQHLVHTLMHAAAITLALTSSQVPAAAAGRPASDALALVQTQLQPVSEYQLVGSRPSTVALALKDAALPAQNMEVPERDLARLDGKAKVDTAQKQQLPHPKPMSGRGRVAQVLPVGILCLISTSKVQQMYSRRQRVSTLKVLEVLAALALYLVSGPAVILVNKHMMREHKFHFPIFLASLGNVFLLVVTRGAVTLGLHKMETPVLDWRRYLRVVLPINVLNFAAQVMGMWAYLFISVPEIQILKSMTIVLVLIFAFVAVNEPVNKLLVTSVLLIAGGTCVSALYDSETRVSGPSAGTAAVGVLLCLGASISEAGKSVTCQLLMDSLSVFDGLYWSTPMFVVIACIFVGAIELRGLLHFNFTGGLVGLLACNALLTGLILLSSFWFIKLAGALTLKVVMQARTIGLILCSVLFFHEHCTSEQYMGYSVTLVGMGLFDYAKTVQAQAKAQKPGAQG